MIFEYHVCSYALSLLSPHSPCFLLDNLGNPSEPIKEAQQFGWLPSEILFLSKA